MDRSAVLAPDGISITAQIEAGTEYQHILESLAVASRASTPAATAEVPTLDAALPPAKDFATESTVAALPPRTPSVGSGWSYDLGEPDVDEDDDESTHFAAAAVDAQ